MSLVGAVGIDLEWHPEVRFGIGVELTAQNADHSVWLIAELNAGADDVLIAAEFPLPQAIAEDDNVTAVGRVLLRREGTAQHDRRSEEAEVCLTRVNPMHLLGNSAGEIEPWSAEVVRSNVLEDAGLSAPVIELCGRGA